MSDQPIPLPEWTQRLPRHDHPTIQAYVTHQIAVVRRYVELTPATCLLEVGCGNGYFTIHFAQFCDVFGIDISEVMLRLNPIKQTALMDAARMDFADNSFDVVFCHETLHHAENPQAILREMHRVARRDAVIIEPNRNNPLMQLVMLLMPDERGARRFSPGYLRGLVSNSGFVVRDAFAYGMMPIVTPPALLTLGKRFNFRQPFGWETFVFAEKPASP